MLETKEKFYTCRSDRAFKEVFMREDSKDILSKVLEAVLEVEVKDIKFLNLERNVDNIHVRRKYFDMFLDTNIGKIQVEVNADYDMSKKLRNTAFICDTYSHLTLKGEKYTDDILVIQINLSYENVKDKYINKIMIRDEDIEIRKGDAIGQGVFAKYLIIDDDNADGIRQGGFGSTSK